jgi:serine/threonine-protein kinase
MFTLGTTDSPDFYDDAAVEAVDIETGARKVLSRGGSAARYIPTGFLIYWRLSSLFAEPFDLGKLEVTGTSVPLLEKVNGDPTTGMADYTVSENGTLAYIPGNAGVNNEILTKVDIHGVMTPFPASAQSYLEPRVSPDGTRIAVTIQSGNETDIWIYDIARKTMSKFTFGGVNRTPAWSPNGKRIAYYTDDGGNHSVVVRQADGSGTSDIIAKGPGRLYIDAWSKDGSVLVLDAPGTARAGLRASGGMNLFILPLAGDHTLKPFFETQFDVYEASLSPDGRWIAYTSNESAIYQVYIRPFPSGGGRWSVSSEECSGAHWAPDGKALYYYTPGRLMSVSIRTTPEFSVGKPQIVLANYRQKQVDSGLMFDIFPDGHSFVVLQSKDDEENLRGIHIILNWFDEIQAKVR